MKFVSTVCYLHVLFLLFGVFCNYSVDGREELDELTSILDEDFYRTIYRNVRYFFHLIAGDTGQRIQYTFLQESIGNFPCNVTNMRSNKVPDSVHRLRPGDIDVVAALGDSLIAAAGASSMNLFEMFFVENRGFSWSMGGQWNWRNASTLPNILKEFNPNLTGYSKRDSFSYNKDSRFNMAENAATSADMPFQAKLLVRRIKHDQSIDFKKTWKMVTITIGGNDICTYICTMENPERLPQNHRQRLLKTLRYLRDNLPRTFVNIVPTPFVRSIAHAEDKPLRCVYFHLFECSCWHGHLFSPNKQSLEFYHRMQMKVHEVEYNLTMMTEFRNLNEFAVVYQPWSEEFSFKKPFDYSHLSNDCFHLSQKGHGLAGVAIWNNLLEKPGNKSPLVFTPSSKRFLCPTEKQPYIFTNDNYSEE